MGDMDDERTEAVVEDKTEALKELSKGGRLSSSASIPLCKWNVKDFLRSENT